MDPLTGADVGAGSRRPTVAVIDDHTLVRQGIAAALVDLAGFDVVHQGADPERLTELPEAPDLVVLDLDLDGSAVTADQAGRIMDRGSAILVVSALGDPRTVREMIRAGVAGFVSKREPLDRLAEAAAAILAGQVWTTPELAGVLANDDAPDRPRLSPQEHRALVLYAAGLKLDSVARRMGVRPATVREYLERVRTKYASVGRPARTKTELYQEALRDGLLDGP